MVLAFLLPMQVLAAWALQLAGPVHTHREVQAQTTSWADSWRPAHPVFQHRRSSVELPGGLPPGFEWAASRTQEGAEAHHHDAAEAPTHPHDPGHANARHHHAPDDGSVQAQDDPLAGQGADGDSATPGAGAALAWATPCDGLRWAAAVVDRPRPGGPVGWRDAAPRLLERPPRRD